MRGGERKRESGGEERERASGGEERQRAAVSVSAGEERGNISEPHHGPEIQ